MILFCTRDQVFGIRTKLRIKEEAAASLSTDTNVEEKTTQWDETLEKGICSLIFILTH